VHRTVVQGVWPKSSFRFRYCPRCRGIDAVAAPVACGAFYTAKLHIIIFCICISERLSLHWLDFIPNAGVFGRYSEEVVHLWRQNAWAMSLMKNFNVKYFLLFVLSVLVMLYFYFYAPQWIWTTFPFIGTFLAKAFDVL